MDTSQEISVREKHYEYVRRRVREATPTGFETPRLSLVECVLCEIIGDLQLQISDLKARLELPAQIGRLNK